MHGKGGRVQSVRQRDQTAFSDFRYDKYNLSSNLSFVHFISTIIIIIVIIIIIIIIITRKWIKRSINTYNKTCKEKLCKESKV